MRWQRARVIKSNGVIEGRQLDYDPAPVEAEIWVEGPPIRRPPWGLYIATNLWDRRQLEIAMVDIELLPEFADEVEFVHVRFERGGGGGGGQEHSGPDQ